MRQYCSVFLALYCYSFLSIAGPNNAKAEGETDDVQQAKITSSHLLKSMIKGIDDHDVLISEVLIPEGDIVPRHTHPTEEYFYVKSGTVILKLDGQPSIEVSAGMANEVPANTVHSAWSKSGLAKVIVFRVHPHGQPDRTPAEH
jgi:quercetin dioxygenase-like cupin family protein